MTQAKNTMRRIGLDLINKRHPIGVENVGTHGADLLSVLSNLFYLYQIPFSPLNSQF